MADKERKRMTRKTAVAEWIGCDVADVVAYQPGRSDPQVFEYEGSYYVAVKGKQKPPEPEVYNWTLMTNAEHMEKRTGFKVYAARD